MRAYWRLGYSQSATYRLFECPRYYHRFQEHIQNTLAASACNTQIVKDLSMVGQKVGLSYEA
jgi:hypothetical protein